MAKVAIVFEDMPDGSIEMFMTELLNEGEPSAGTDNGAYLAAILAKRILDGHADGDLVPTGEENEGVKN